MDAGTLPPDITPDHKAWNRARWFAESTVHLSSLLHGLALQHLRNDWDLANLTMFHNVDPPPPMVRSSGSSLAGLASRCVHCLCLAHHALEPNSISNSAAASRFYLPDKSKQAKDLELNVPFGTCFCFLTAFAFAYDLFL